MVDTHQRETLYLVMEFGGMNLRDYFNERIKKVRDEGKIELTKIIRGAAIALEQFHKCMNFEIIITLESRYTAFFLVKSHKCCVTVKKFIID